MNTNVLSEIIASTKRLVTPFEWADMGCSNHRISKECKARSITKEVEGHTLIMGVDATHMTFQVLSTHKTLAAAGYNTNESPASCNVIYAWCRGRIALPLCPTMPIKT